MLPTWHATWHSTQMASGRIELPTRRFPARASTGFKLVAMTIRVVEVRPGRWSYMIDGEFPTDLYDSTWGLTTFPSPDDAQRAAKSRSASNGFVGKRDTQ